MILGIDPIYILMGLVVCMIIVVVIMLLAMRGMTKVLKGIRDGENLSVHYLNQMFLLWSDMAINRSVTYYVPESESQSRWMSSGSPNQQANIPDQSLAPTVGVQSEQS